MPISVKDLAARISYASQYPAMVQYTMLCDYVEGRNWPHRVGVRVDEETIAAHLSLAAGVAEYRGEAPRDWVGYTLSEEDHSVVREVAVRYPILEQIPEWFGHNTATRRWALVASGALDDLDYATYEIALGLLDGWDSCIHELLDAARRLT